VKRILFETPPRGLKPQRQASRPAATRSWQSLAEQEREERGEREEREEREEKEILDFQFDEARKNHAMSHGRVMLHRRGQAPRWVKGLYAWRIP